MYKVFLAILIITSLSFQLIGAFFLATQIIPKTWLEGLGKNLHESYEKFLKIETTKRKQLKNLREELSTQSLAIGIFKFLTPIVLFFEPVDSREYLDESEESYVRVKELLKGMAGIMKIIRLIERGILSIGNGNLLRLFHLFLSVLLGATLYLIYGFGIVRESAQKITHLLIERTIRIFSYFSKRQGEEIFALLGIFLLAVGFIFQAIVNWLAIK